MVYRAQGSVYHIKCFVCVTCRHPLQPGDRYGLINGSLVCEQDYPKLAKGQGQVPLPARTTHKVGVGPGTRGGIRWVLGRAHVEHKVGVGPGTRGA